MNKRINALAQALADCFGDRVLDVVGGQVEAAEGDVKRVWGQIMARLLLLCQDEATRPAE